MVSVHSSLPTLKWNESWLLTSGLKLTLIDSQLSSSYWCSLNGAVHCGLRQRYQAIMIEHRKIQRNIGFIFNPKTSSTTTTTLPHWVVMHLLTAWIWKVEGLNPVNDKSWAVIIVVMVTNIAYCKLLCIKVPCTIQISNDKYAYVIFSTLQ